MNETTFNPTDTGFNLDNAAGYTLLAQAGGSTLWYAVTHNSQMLATGQVADDENNELYSARFKQVVVGLKPVAYTLIPEAVYQDDQLDKLALLLDVKDNESVLVQQLDAENRVLYKIDAETAALAKNFGFENTVFGLKGWVKAVAGSNPADDTLYADINGHTVSVLYYHYGKLRFLNTFDFYTPDELVYYTVLVAEQLKMQPKKMHICLSGAVDADDDNAARLADFFEAVETTNLHILQTPADTAPHSVLQLAALSLCG